MTTEQDSMAQQDNNLQQVLFAVKEDGARTRESIGSIASELRDLPSNLATAIKAETADKPVLPPQSTNNAVWSLATLGLALGLVFQYVNGVNATNAKIDEQLQTTVAQIEEYAREDDGVTEELKVKVARLQTTVEQLSRDKDNLYDIVARYRVGQVSEAHKEIAELKRQLSDKDKGVN